MRNAECGMYVEGRPAVRTSIAIPHSAFRIPPFGVGRRGGEAGSAPGPARDQRRRGRVPAGRGRGGAFPAHPRLVKERGLPQGASRGGRAARGGRPPRGGRGDGARRPGAARPDPGHRLVLPVPRQDDPQVLPLFPVRVAARRAGAAGGGGDHRLRVASAGRGGPHDLVCQRARCARACGGDGPGPRARPDRASGTRRGEAGGGRGMTPPLVPVFHPRREARRAVRQGYPRGAGVVRLCRSLAGGERLLYSRLVDAVVLDVKAAPALELPARFPRIPMYVLSAFRPDDGALLAACPAAGVPGLLVEGGDNAIAGGWVAGRTAQGAGRDAVPEAPKLVRVPRRLPRA